MFTDHVNVSQILVPKELLPGDGHNDTVYISASPGYEKDSFKFNVYLPLKLLYGMPSAARTWHTTIDSKRSRKSCKWLQEGQILFGNQV